MVNASGRTLTSFPADSFRPKTVYGVDFSGAKLAGKNAWIAQLDVQNSLGLEKSVNPIPPLKLVDLRPLGRAAGGDERETVYSFLTGRILESRSALWGMDFPFGLPIELALGQWPEQLQHVSQHDGDAKSYGRSLVARAKEVGDSMHVRRASDLETKTPFDCYHYRIIYQTFHGMRDVLAPIAGQPATRVMPFEDQPEGADETIERVAVEACPSSTLKRWGLPHQNYKQPGDQPPDERRRQTRRIILKKLATLVDASPHRRRVMMNNPGGDAIDAVLAGVGAWQAWHREDHEAIAEHPRYRVEGRVYC